MERLCKTCGAVLVRKEWWGKRRYREASTRFGQRMYCGLECSAKALKTPENAKRLGKWSLKGAVSWNTGKGKGWKAKDERGYVRVFSNAKEWEYEHRQMFSDIPEGYEVHHINGNTSDNRISNLKLVTRLEHRRLHSESKIAYSTT